MVEEKRFDGPLNDYDDNSYDETVEVQPVISKEKLINDIDLTKADPRQLLLYFCSRFKETQGYDYNVDWVRETAILKSFKERYGADSGPMIKVLFDKHKGKINDMVMTITAFSKGSKWIQDTLYVALQQNRIKEENKPSSEGLLTTDDFIKRFNV